MNICVDSVKVCDLPFLGTMVDNASFKQTALIMSTERVKAIGVKQRHYQYTWGISEIYEACSLTSKPG